jgi:hypothetical protein
MAKKHAEEVLRRYQDTLPVKLSEKELRARGSELAVAQGALEQHVAKAKDVRSKQNAKKKELEAECSRLASAVRDGEEGRKVDVIVRLGRAPGFVDVIRLDTEEVIESRPMSEKEAQRDLVDEGAGDEDGPEARA